jgi:glutamyl/glutaminyl-tRNA synthetase
MAEKKVRVRFAPSPTGALHIGGVRTALYNYLFARQHHGDFVFRIEDTDSHRFVPGAEEYIIESFKWLGIQFDEGVSFGGNYGPYRQSERREIYKKYVKILLDGGQAYLAFDTPDELEAKRKESRIFNMMLLRVWVCATLCRCRKKRLTSCCPKANSMSSVF